MDYFAISVRQEPALDLRRLQSQHIFKHILMFYETMAEQVQLHPLLVLSATELFLASARLVQDLSTALFLSSSSISCLHRLGNLASLCIPHKRCSSVAITPTYKSQEGIQDF